MMVRNVVSRSLTGVALAEVVPRHGVDRRVATPPHEVAVLSLFLAPADIRPPPLPEVNVGGDAVVPQRER